MDPEAPSAPGLMNFAVGISRKIAELEQPAGAQSLANRGSGLPFPSEPDLEDLPSASNLPETYAFFSTHTETSSQFVLGRASTCDSLENLENSEANANSFVFATFRKKYVLENNRRNKKMKKKIDFDWWYFPRKIANSRNNVYRKSCLKISSVIPIGLNRQTSLFGAQRPKKLSC